MDILKLLKSATFVTREKYLRAIEPCIKLALERNKKYGNSVALMEDTSIIDLIIMKLYRTKELLKTGNDPKFFDEIKDSINYLVYLLIRRLK